MCDRFEISDHAREKLDERRIPYDVLDSILRSPQQVVPEQRGRNAYQSIVELGDAGTFLVRAIVDDTKDPAVVVTV